MSTSSRPEYRWLPPDANLKRINTMRSIMGDMHISRTMTIQAKNLALEVRRLEELSYPQAVHK